MHPTKTKSSLALSKTIADLVSKDIEVFLPFSEHLRYDLVALYDNRFVKIQIKYSNDGMVKRGTVHCVKKQWILHKYNKEDFDYYAVYLPQIDTVIYPSFSFMGCTIRHKLPTTYCEFYWYEDFLNFTDDANKRSLREFGDFHYDHFEDGESRKHKIKWPTKEELEEMVWKYQIKEMGKLLGVSEKSVAKWLDKYQIKRPHKGYWLKKENKPR